MSEIIPRPSLLLSSILLWRSSQRTKISHETQRLYYKKFFRSIIYFSVKLLEAVPVSVDKNHFNQIKIQKFSATFFYLVIDFQPTLANFSLSPSNFTAFFPCLFQRRIYVPKLEYHCCGEWEYFHASVFMLTIFLYKELT